jgi:hypothetical protein
LPNPVQLLWAQSLGVAYVVQASGPVLTQAAIAQFERDSAASLNLAS